jgi:hypothetical protein
MGGATGFNTDKTLGHLGEEGQHIPAPQRPGHNHAACRVDTMNLKDVLGQIKADGPAILNCVESWDSHRA